MGAELIEMLVASNSIVETLDVIEDFLLGLCSGAVDQLLDLLTRQVTEDRFSNCVIPAVPARDY